MEDLNRITAFQAENTDDLQFHREDENPPGLRSREQSSLPRHLINKDHRAVDQEM
jgi:hypothetical protein